MLVTSRLIANCIILLVLIYVVLSEDLINCDNGEQGDETDEVVICDPPENASQIQDCFFILATESTDYEPINCLKMVNRGNDSVAGTPEVAVGGVGYTYIIGDIYSQPGEGVNYTVSVWSIPINKSDTTLPPTTTTTEETTIQETTTTTPEVTTTKVSTTTAGGSRRFTNSLLLLCGLGYCILKFVF